MIARERTIGAYADGPKSEVHVVEGAVYTEWKTIYLENVVNVYRMIFARVGNRPDKEAAGEMGVTAGNAKFLQFRALRLAADIGQRMLS